MTSDSPISLGAYEQLAEAYAAGIDTKPHNAYYERPATLSLLPEVRGLRVLDAGCGPGVYAEWLANRGASVMAVDASPKMLALARARVGPGVEFIEADLRRELSFLEDAAFDLVVSPLVLDPLLHAGFELVRLLEPKPTEEFKEADPRGYAKLMRQPGFLCIRARKR